MKHLDTFSMFDESVRILTNQMAADFIGMTLSNADSLIRESGILHYSENIDLNLIAELVNITPSHLSNLFKKETGVNFSTYLTDVRMKAARKLLQPPEFLIYEVAEKTGYSNAGYFGKAFKKYWGISPEELKKELRKEFTYYAGYQRTCQAILRDVQYAL
uniref:helix-turn-helix transcriptional regulator n=1 Tax=Enterocloster clostridioformis TaxID=1531 RepID=UPI001EFFF7D1|nr:helix-turn-helix domain-containing protein [Enterocloster clostridioformis]